jgi:hypothetical protein
MNFLTTGSARSARRAKTFSGRSLKKNLHHYEKEEARATVPEVYPKMENLLFLLAFNAI